MTESDPFALLIREMKNRGASKHMLDLISQVMEECGDTADQCFRERWADYMTAWEGCMEAQREIAPGQAVAVIGNSEVIETGVVVPYPPGWDRLRDTFPFAKYIAMGRDYILGKRRFTHALSVIPISHEAFEQSLRDHCMVRHGTIAWREVTEFWEQFAATADPQVQ